MHQWIQSSWHGLHRRQDEGFKVTTSSSSFWRLVPLVVSFCCDIPEGIHMSDVLHGTTVHLNCIHCLVSREAICSIKCTVLRNRAGTLSAPEKYEMIMDSGSRMKAVMHGQIREEERLKAERTVSSSRFNQFHHSWRK